ncbi:MAG: BA14K family protein [Rhizobiaceae bacterium]|nr:BA14K family protein [Rhizobiaceae bacterium]
MIPGQWLVAGLILATTQAAGAIPFARPNASDLVIEVQLDCTGPRCLTIGPIRQPYLQGTRPPQLPGREMFRQSPFPPPVKLQQPEMDYRVPKMQEDKPLVREIRPPDPTYRATGLPQKHIDWCYARYRSYRESDNSWQPFSGPRRQCQSPDG